MQAKLRGLLNAETIIYCSDFKRTTETASLAQQILKAGETHPSPALRERSFGKYNGKHANTYIEIWPQDQMDEEDQQRNGVEDAEKMLGRFLDFIKGLEIQYQHQCLLLVSHGDPLQVVQGAFAGLGATQSRLLKYIEPAEIKS